VSLQFVLLTRYYWGDQISNKLGAACGMDGPKVKHNTCYDVELTGKVCSEDSGTDWMMVLKWTLKNRTDMNSVD